MARFAQIIRSPLSTDGVEKQSVTVKYTDLLVFDIADVNFIITGNSDRTGVVELARISAGLGKTLNSSSCGLATATCPLS